MPFALHMSAFDPKRTSRQPTEWSVGCVWVRCHRNLEHRLDTEYPPEPRVGAMPYQFERGRIYRMPTHFGPAPGPRQIPAEANADPTRSPRKKVISTSFLTDGAALERHIPERFALAGEPVVTVEFHFMTDIDWLAGRGY